MTDLQTIQIILDRLIKRSYLPENYFRISNTILQNAVNSFRSDYYRWYPESDTVNMDRLFMTPQLIAMLCYRISHNISKLPPPDSKLSAEAYSILGREIGQIEIFYSSLIGKGLKINHGVGTVIGARCIIGNNCTIHQNCTLGDRNGGRPTIGNNVIIYAGSLILGNITIGDNSIIGANSVVTHSCPKGSVLVGSPAKIIKTTR